MMRVVSIGIGVLGCRCAGAWGEARGPGDLAVWYCCCSTPLAQHPPPLFFITTQNTLEPPPPKVYKPLHATLDEMAAFHHRDYLEYLAVADRGGDRVR
jgi:hypothetical protein